MIFFIVYIYIGNIVEEKLLSVEAEWKSQCDITEKKYRKQIEDMKSNFEKEKKAFLTENEMAVSELKSEISALKKELKTKENNHLVVPDEKSAESEIVLCFSKMQISSRTPSPQKIKENVNEEFQRWKEVNLILEKELKDKTAEVEQLQSKVEELTS